MKQNAFAYVCAPMKNTAQYCKTLYELGYVPIAPNLMFAKFLSDAVPEQREARRAMSMKLLRRCRVLVVCSDEVSEEMESEILLAKRIGIVATTLAGIKKISLHAAKGEDTE